MKSYFWEEIYFEHYGKFNSPEAAIFMHGFQGRSTKYEDLAEHISKNLRMQVYVVHYPGLNRSSGRFNFCENIGRMGEFLLSVAHQDKSKKKVHLLGHSYGGLVTLNLLHRHPEMIKSLIQICPLLSIDEFDASLEELAIEFIAEQNIHTKKYSVEGVKKDAERLRTDFSPMKIASKIKIPPGGYTILHGENDDVIAIEGTRNFMKLAPKGLRLKSWPDDHWLFQDRQRCLYEGLNHFKRAIKA